MKKIYQQPEIWVEELRVECQVMAGNSITTKEVLRSTNNASIGYGGGGNEEARTNGIIWDECDGE